MEDQFYTELFEFFRTVARKVAPSVGNNKDLCREIFHERVLFPKRVRSVDAAVERMEGRGKPFRNSKAYANWLFTIFKNALLDHLREKEAEGKRGKFVPPDYLAALPDRSSNAPMVDLERLEKWANALKSKLSWEERRLITLRYNEEKTLQQAATILRVSTSTVSRWEQKILHGVKEALSKPGAELEEEEQLLFLESFLKCLIKGQECRGDLNGLG